MKDGLKVALAVIAGYYFGRHHKMRLALIILAGQLPGQGTLGSLLEQRTKVLGGATPDVGKITERVRGDLLDIGKAAATRAASHQIDTLSDKLHERAETLRRPKTGGPAEEETSEEGRRRAPRPPGPRAEARTPKRPTRRRPNPSPSLRRGRSPGFVSPGP
jgi:hypothetical protein